MPLARIEIEQIEINRWHAEIEAGGMPGARAFRREAFNADSFEAIVAAVARVYREAVPPPTGTSMAVGTWAERRESSQGEVIARLEDENFARRAPVDSEHGFPIQRLQRIADEMGIKTDKRWGEARLREAIAAHEADTNA